MAQTGTLLVRVYVSRAQLPISGATVIVAAADGDGRHQILAVRITDDSGLAGPLTLPAPDTGASQSPGQPHPFSSYLLLVEHPEYEMAAFLDLQVFPGVQTIQDVAMVPRRAQGGGSGVTIVTPQPL